MENQKSRIQEILSQGENRRVEFKSGSVRADSLAVEMSAFANTAGGIILVGVEDNGDITGIERTDFEEWVSNIARQNIVPAIQPEVYNVTIDQKNIGVIEIPKGAYKPYQTIDGRYRIRVGSTNRIATKEELSRLFQQSGLVHFDISHVDGTSVKDLDINRLHQYWSTYYEIFYQDLEQEEQLNILLNADIINKTEDTLNATVGGLLIFGKNPQRRLPHSSIIFAVFSGNDITSELLNKKEICGTLTDIIDNTAGLMELYIPKPSVINGLKREEISNIPRKVIRESLVNAVCHRDYSIANQKITVYKFSDRFEITSPGNLPNTLTVEKVRYGNSAPRNLFLLKYLDNFRYIDGLGRGIPMMIKLMGQRAVFEEIGDRFRVILRLI
ncbi:MAG: RNA-binding domain-containing protein [Desulfococcaceae bacterium]|jgi:ATP-dependent DNA helicase RecG|nr:RNA-binding domain-containing protein [Desulfococcaceae bacterium]